MFFINRFNKLCWMGLNLKEICQKQFISLYCRRNSVVCSKSPLLSTGTPARNKLRIGASYEFSDLLIRHKSDRRNNTGTEANLDEEENDSDYESNNVLEDFHDNEEDYDAPTVFREMKVNSLRADHIAAKGLGLSKSSTDTNFYQSKLLLNGNTLLKKAKQLYIGDYIDLIMEKNGNKLIVQRVKLKTISDEVTKKGKPVAVVRAWRKPFEIDTPS